MAQATLSRWLLQARTIGLVPKKTDKDTPTPDPLRKERSPDEKLRLVLEAARLSDAELGAFLRREGLHEADLDAWRDAMLAGLKPAKSKHARSPEARRVKQLERELHRKDKALAEAAVLLVLQKSPGPLGGRGRRHGEGERRVTLVLIDEAVAAGARLEKACEVVGISNRTLERWRADEECIDRRAGPKHAPAHQLSEAEKQKILEVANSPEFRDKSPKQIVPTLADRGEYIASEASFYRVLREHDQLAHRGRARPPTASRPKELVAKVPNQIWCWDITYMRAAVHGSFYFLYLVVDAARHQHPRAVHLDDHARRARCGRGARAPLARAALRSRPAAPHTTRQSTRPASKRRSRESAPRREHFRRLPARAPLRNPLRPDIRVRHAPGLRGRDHAGLTVRCSGYRPSEVGRGRVDVEIQAV